MSKSEITRKVNKMNEIFADSKWIASATDDEKIAMEKHSEYSLGDGQSANVNIKLIVNVKRTKDGLGETNVESMKAKYIFTNSKKHKRELCKEWDSVVTSKLTFETFDEMTKDLMSMEGGIAIVMKRTALMTWMKAGSFRVKFGGVSVGCNIKPSIK